MDNSTDGKGEPNGSHQGRESQELIGRDDAHGEPADAEERAPTQGRAPRPVRIMGETAVKEERTTAKADETPTAAAPLAKQSPQAHKVKPDLRSEEHVRGSHPGDRYIRYGRNVGPFRRKGGGVLSASLAADQPRSRIGKLFNRLKRVFIGLPISTEQSIHERLTNAKALAVLSSDALSSVAYATEEILKILILAGTAALSWALPLGLGIVVLMAIVVSSYRQTIAAYPRGGGSYIVAKDNLGTLPGLTAASSILIGYILTVAVSISAGVAALYSLYPALEPFKVELCVGLIGLVTLANLRGIREAGNIFAVPTYLFIVGILAMVAFGLARVFLGVGGPMVYTPPEAPPVLEGLGLVLLLRAFTQGSAALTGVEAIADGVPAFKPPEYVNARKTLLWMAVLAIAMFSGITYLATDLKILPSDKETIVSQLAKTIFGANVVWYYIQIATALILVLAANTAFSDFPRLSYFLARDRFMPHQYSFRGDRLAYSWGIVTLAILAAVLCILFGGDTSALIPLYSIGVFGAFTFSQSGMVARWWKTRSPGWQRNMLINGIGALTTFGVFIISAVTKFNQGTWIVLILIPAQIAVFLAINRHYQRFGTEVKAVTPLDYRKVIHTVVVPVASLNAVALSALAYARSISPNVTAVHIAEGEDPEAAHIFNDEWKRLLNDTDIQLVIIESPYRSLVGPLMSYIDALDQQTPNDTITVVIPELIPARPLEYVLHNQSALRLKAALLFRPNTVVANIPYVIGSEQDEFAVRSRSFFRQVPFVPIGVLLALLLLFYYIFWH